jgi:hypothetical protein
VAEAGRDRLLRLPCGTNQRPVPGGVPLPRHEPLATHASAPQPEGSDDVGAGNEARRRLAPAPAHPPPLAKPALRRQAPEVGAGCGNAARPDLCGGRSAMSVPTAITNHKNCGGCCLENPGAATVVPNCARCMSSRAGYSEPDLSESDAFEPARDCDRDSVISSRRRLQVADGYGFQPPLP